MANRLDDGLHHNNETNRASNGRLAKNLHLLTGNVKRRWATGGNIFLECHLII